MARAVPISSIKAIANQRAEDYLWGLPESPEFSAVQRLVNEFQAHEREEERWLSIYKRIREGSDDPMIGFLLNLIIGDEERHRELIGLIVSSLKDDLASRGSERGTREEIVGKNREELREMLERFLAVERKGIKEYERLEKVSRGFHQDLFALICRTMTHDSLKHIGILEFLRLKLKTKPSPERKRQK